MQKVFNGNNKIKAFEKKKWTAKHTHTHKIQWQQQKKKSKGSLWMHEYLFWKLFKTKIERMWK